MKFVIGIILVSLLIGALAVYLVLMLNAHDMVFCGDVTNENGSGGYVTRVYTTDLSADETLSEIVLAMNSSEEDSVSVDQLTEILAKYQNIIYAPVFIVNLEQADASTYVLTGNVYNGLTDKGEPAQPDYIYRNMVVTAGLNNARVLAAQNIYPTDEKGNPEFVERKLVVDPIVTDENRGAAFSLKDIDTFRLVFTADNPETLPSVTFAYTYDVVAENPLDFTGIDDGVLAFTVTVAYDEDGLLDPDFRVERVIVKEKKD